MYLLAVNLDNPREMAASQVVDGRAVRFGRKPESFPEEEVEILRVSWSDRYVSRNHGRALREGETVKLWRLPALPGRNVPNPLYTNARPSARVAHGEEPVVLRYGDSVALGARGSTALYWLKSLGDLDEALASYRAALEEEEDEDEDERGEFEEAVHLRNQGYDEVSQLDDYSLRLQLKLLQRDLPEQVLTGWSSEMELLTRASVFLENALPGQKGVSVVFLALERAEEGLRYEILNPDPHARADFRPSRTLLERVKLDTPNPADVHVWSLKEHERVFRAESLARQVDWVIVIPLARLDENAAIHRDEAGRPVYLYVETRQSSDTAAASFVPFIRLITSLVASLLSARSEQKLQDQMAAYFSPALRRLMQQQDQSVLEPAMVDCTIMFADRRGHSRMLEVAKSDSEILERLDENQRVVGLITEEIFRSNGVVTDFAGDGALGLWGWPSFGDQDNERDHALGAIEAAEAILHRLATHVAYEEEQERLMAAVRIGISTGRLAVGKTGPSQQWHISVFGSVANLGARLERIAKEFRIPILVSDDTYRRIASLGGRRFRKLCLIRPAGFEEGYAIHELVLPRKLGGSGIEPDEIEVYENALGQFLQRRWDDTIALLETLPKEDPPTAWLLQRTRDFRKNPPSRDWGGEIQSFSK